LEDDLKYRYGRQAKKRKVHGRQVKNKSNIADRYGIERYVADRQKI